MKKVLFSAMIIAAVVSCSKSETENPIGPDGTNEIKLTAGLTGTKAAFGAGSAVNGLQFLRKDATAQMPTSFVGGVPVTGNLAADDKITFDNKQYYHATDNSYFVSYYPAGTVGTENVTWGINGKVDIMTTENPVDVGTNLAKLTTAMKYQHRLAQVEVIVTGDDAAGAAARWGNVTAIALANTPISMSCDYATMGVSTSGAPTANIALSHTDYTGTFVPTPVPDAASVAVVAAGMFAPSASRTITLMVQCAGGTETDVTPRTVVVDFDEGKSLTAGHKHTITLKFAKTPSTDEIKATATIEDWKPGNTGTGGIN